MKTLDYNSNNHKLSLTKELSSQLAYLGYQGAALLSLGLLWWGTIAPQLIGRDALPIQTASRLGGITMIIILAGNFASAYFMSDVRGITRDQKTMGFIIFWFNSSLFFNIVWQLPLWSLPFIRNNVKSLQDGNLWWAIIWWCYSLSDNLYLQCTLIMKTFEIWWLVGNIFGFIGLYKFKHNKVKESLCMFLLCGMLQVYNRAAYMFMTYFIDDFKALKSSVSIDIDQVDPPMEAYLIFWGFNGLFALTASLAAYHSWQLLFLTIKYDK